MADPKQIYDQMMSKDYCSQWMGIQLVDIEEGYVKLSMKVKKEMLNGFGILHGGMAFALADSAFAFATNSYGRVSVSIQGSINYSKPAKEGDVLIAETTPLNLSNKTAEFDVTITNGKTQEKLYFFRGTVYRTSKNFE